MCVLFCQIRFGRFDGFVQVSLWMRGGLDGVEFLCRAAVSLDGGTLTRLPKRRNAAKSNQCWPIRSTEYGRWPQARERRVTSCVPVLLAARTDGVEQRWVEWFDFIAVRLRSGDWQPLCIEHRRVAVVPCI